MFYLFHVKKSIPRQVHAATEASIVGSMLVLEMEKVFAADPDMDVTRLQITRDKSVMHVTLRHRNGPLYNRCWILVGPGYLLPDAATRPVEDWYKAKTSVVTPGPSVKLQKLQDEIARLHKEIAQGMDTILSLLEGSDGEQATKP
jgi:hypothetical protein